jgi:2-oxoacid:acceptor oxidoreductase gamma subunit (pyruvate/2-ketoisovalerate family)
MEIRIHGRGGQGGVTCAKLLAAVYAGLGKSVQAFGDYAGERSGAPVRAYVRVGDEPITNRNKVYRPDHLLVLDRSLLDAQTLAGLAPGGLLLVNSAEPPDALAALAPGCRRATVDATAIARRHGIGSRSLVIVNTTLAGAFARALDLPFAALAAAYRDLGLAADLEAAREAWDAVRMGPAIEAAGAPAERPAEPIRPRGPEPAPILDLVAHRSGPAPALRTGGWRTQTPRYARHPSPCNAACPAGNDVVGFVQALARDGEEAAAEVLGRTTPLPGVCGRVCPAFCMESCNRGVLDGAVEVRSLERWVADRVPVARFPDPSAPGAGEAVAPLRPWRVAVVGGGPAGLSAAYALLRHGHRPTVFEAAAELGGLLRYGIPQYRLPPEVLDAELGALLDLGLEVRCGAALGPAEVAELADRYDGVILATGQQRRRGLEVPGAGLPGVVQGLDFLARGAAAGAGRPPVRNAVVLGGGSTAVDCARSALRAGAERVTLAYRRSRAEMPAIPEEVAEAVEEGVELQLLRAPLAFHGNGRVTRVELAEMVLGEPDPSGRRRPLTGEGRFGLDCDLVLLALGLDADADLLPPAWSLTAGCVWTGDEALPVVAAGDLATGDGTVAHAIGDGHGAALALLERLEEPVAPWLRLDPAAAVPPERIRLDHFAPRPPARRWRRPAAVRRRDWDEVAHGLESAEEAGRCFACGDCTRCDTCLVYCPEGAILRDGEAYVIDYDVCKGCGLCVAECPRDGMEMVDAWLPS